MWEFYRFAECGIRAIKLTPTTQYEVRDAIAEEVRVDKINYFTSTTLKSNNSKCLVFDFKYAQDTEVSQLTIGNYLLKLSNGKLVVANAEEFEKNYTVRSEMMEEVNADTVEPESLKDKDAVIYAGKSPLSESKVFTAKSVDVKSMDTASAPVELIGTEGPVLVSNFESTGNIDKDTCHYALRVSTNDEVYITGSTLGQTGYNGIEVRCDTKDNRYPSKITIDNVYFEGILTNNAINIFGWQDGAEITISNCYFAGISNPFRFSSRTGKSATINIVNCSVEAWSYPDPKYTGFILFEEEENAVANCPNGCTTSFCADKITLKITNCSTPNGKITPVTKLSTICGTGDEKQIIYVWSDKDLKIVPYSEKAYPKIIIKS